VNIHTEPVFNTEDRTMPPNDSYASSINIEAEQLLAKVNADLQKSDEFFASLGVKPEKIAPALEQHMGPRQKEELAQMIRQDQEAIQREVDEGAARWKFSTPSPATSGGPKRPRPMV
jgi:hypothetical protein